jgi:uncharacterized protein YabN with tetrapyrrole methylase and pyrophosphatase domain
VKEEIGDLLFTTVNLSRFQKIEAEDALEGTIAKFLSRFRKVEEAVFASGRKLADCSLAELDALWEETKKSERAGKRRKTVKRKARHG